MAKWIAAERRRPVLGILEDLLALSAKRLNSLKDSWQVFYVEIEVHGCPMTLVPATITRIGRWLGTGTLLKQA